MSKLGQGGGTEDADEDEEGVEFSGRAVAREWGRNCRQYGNECGAKTVGAGLNRAARRDWHFSTDTLAGASVLVPPLMAKDLKVRLRRIAFMREPVMRQPARG